MHCRHPQKEAERGVKPNAGRNKGRREHFGRREGGRGEERKRAFQSQPRQSSIIVVTFSTPHLTHSTLSVLAFCCCLFVFSGFIPSLSGPPSLPPSSPPPAPQPHHATVRSTPYVLVVIRAETWRSCVRQNKSCERFRGVVRVA